MFRRPVGAVSQIQSPLELNVWSDFDVTQYVKFSQRRGQKMSSLKLTELLDHEMKILNWFVHFF